MNLSWSWGIPAVAALLVVLAVAGLMVLRRRRTSRRRRRLVEHRANGRLPDDVAGALRRANRRARGAG